jgi:predicted DNA-binding protein
MDKEKLVRTSVYLSVGMLDRLRKASKETGLTMIMIIRKAVDRYLSDEK